ncbi:hypothetical protein KM043_001342 [Ampulex compressa]|nr:hypothetical protein KM043_001342 [Ampulex compressa]
MPPSGAEARRTGGDNDIPPATLPTYKLHVAALSPGIAVGDKRGGPAEDFLPGAKQHPGSPMISLGVPGTTTTTTTTTTPTTTTTTTLPAERRFWHRS